MHYNFWATMMFFALITAGAVIMFRPRNDSTSVAIEWWEGVIVLFLTLLIHTVGWNIAVGQQASAVEFLNGHIEQKGSTDWQFDVCDSYETDKDGHSHCTRSHTEYRTNYWANTNYAQYFANEGHLNYGDVVRGDAPPAAWTAANVGDPVTTLHTYTNNVKGAGRLNQMFPVSYMTEELKKANAFPPLPTSLHSFNYAPKVLYIGGTPLNAAYHTVRDGIYTLDEASVLLNAVNDPLGNAKQANVQIFYVVGRPMEYANAYMDYAEGGGKNDVNVFIGLDNSQSRIEWATVRFGLVGFDQTDESNGGSNAMLDTKLSRELRHKTLDELGGYNGIVTLAGEYVNTYFDRVPNKQFKFLEAEFEPRGGWDIFNKVVSGLAFFVMLFVSLVMDIREVN